MQVGALGATIGGGKYTVPIDINPAYSSLVSGVAKHCAPVIGSAIDFTMQVKGGEDVTDAAIKTGAHVAIASGVGMAVGGPVGFALAVGATMAFDYVYDEYKDDVIEFCNSAINTIEDVGDDIGDAVLSFGNNIGNLFD